MHLERANTSLRNEVERDAKKRKQLAEEVSYWKKNGSGKLKPGQVVYCSFTKVTRSERKKTEIQDNDRIF